MGNSIAYCGCDDHARMWGAQKDEPEEFLGGAREPDVPRGAAGNGEFDSPPPPPLIEPD